MVKRGSVRNRSWMAMIRSGPWAGPIDSAPIWSRMNLPRRDENLRSLPSAVREAKSGAIAAGFKMRKRSHGQCAEIERFIQAWRVHWRNFEVSFGGRDQIEEAVSGRQRPPLCGEAGFESNVIAAGREIVDTEISLRRDVDGDVVGDRPVFSRAGRGGTPRRNGKAWMSVVTWPTTGLPVPPTKE